MFVPKLEKFIGMEFYATRSKGIGGVLRHSAEDFVVEEVFVDGSKAETNPSMTSERRVFNLSKTGGDYLLCILTKRNWDNFLAVKAVAEQLGINSQRIRVAGIKDAKALTAQFITIEGVKGEVLSKVKVKDICIQPKGYFRCAISPYHLLGNDFQITIRAIRHSKTTIKERVEKAITEIEALGGAPNFFGHQRFGTTRPITHLVGKALIQERFRKAAMIFLAKPSPYEHPESRKARELLRDTRDFKQALRVFPKSLRYERLMLRRLAEKPDDFLGAFKQLPKRLLKLFPQAYQAYLFNKFLSRRIKNGLPLNVTQIGDYVVSVEHSGLPILNMRRIVSTESLSDINIALKAGRMRLALPLVGFKQGFSKGLQGEIERQILEEEGVLPEDFKMKRIREIGAKGELRTAITPLKNFSLDEATKDSANPSKNKVKLHFMLLRGSYATVLLREIMKTKNPIKAGF